MEDIGHFNEKEQLAKLAAGFKGGPFFKNPNLAPAMTVDEGYPPSVAEKYEQVNAIPGTTSPGWNARKQMGS